MSDEKDEKLEDEAETPENEARRGGEARGEAREEAARLRRDDDHRQARDGRRPARQPGPGGRPGAGQVRPLRAAQGAARGRPHPRQVRGRRACHPRHYAAGGRARRARLLDSAIANAENNHELVADELQDRKGLRRRGADAQALPAACAGPGHADPQAHQPHDHPAHYQGRRLEWDRRSTPSPSASATSTTGSRAGSTSASSTTTCSRTSASATTSSTSSRTPASRTSRSRRTRTRSR